jgi:hypothetical protein
MKGLLLGVLLVGCGDVTVNDPAVSVNTQKATTVPAATQPTAQPAATTPPPAAKEKVSTWTPAQIDTEVTACKHSTLERNFVTPSQATTYCACLVAVVSKEWTHAEAAASDADRIAKTLEKMGSFDTCATEAGLTYENADDVPKLAKGMTKAEVIAITGKPETISSDGTYTVFNWVEDPKFAMLCGNPNGFSYVKIDCSLIFDDQGRLVGQRNIDTNWLDIENF